MPAPYIHTPRANDATYLSNDGLDGISPEKSFAAPQADGDLLTQMRKARANGMNLKTPRVTGRDPLKLIPNGNQVAAKPEFTPLMRSVTKNNIARRMSAKRAKGSITPAHLRNSYLGGATPALPRMEEESNIHSELTGSSAGRNDDTPMLQNISSSAHSTPLAQLPGRDAVVNDGNMMTLREQEHIIDKIEKENFGLKMKIHFLEEAIAKRGGDFNQAALKENTDLKVSRITMQRELHKFKKTLAQAERDAEIYRQQLQEYRERVRRKQLDESIRVEVESVRSELKIKDAEIEELRTRCESVKGRNDSEVDKLRDEIGDLQAELREKDRLLETKEDEIDSLHANSKKDSGAATELEDELESAKQQIEDLKEDLERAVREAKQARDDREEAMDEKRRAEGDLDELRDEMANKSFTTKGLSRQLEEKVDKLEEDNEELEQKQVALQAEIDEKTRSERELRERLREVEKDGVANVRQLQQELEDVQQQREGHERKYLTSQRQVESLERDLRIKADEKDLLQVRHDALTAESAELQAVLTTARRTQQEVAAALEQERQHSAQIDNTLRTQHKNEIDLLNEQVDSLHREVNAKEKNHEADIEEWQSLKRELEAASQRAEEKANGLQRTVDALNDAQGTLTGREMRLQDAVESEKQRHLEEEKILTRQIQELNEDLANKRAAADGNRTELNNAREELRISIREQATLKEKVVELEDEIEVLQADIEQEHEFVQQLQQKSSSAADVHLAKLQKEKKDLQESLASVNAELYSAKRTAEAVESERDDLEAKLERLQRQNDDTFDAQNEKREWRRLKQSLEMDVEKLRAERDSLSVANDALEIEINAEMERASTVESQLQKEIDQLKNKQITTVDTKEREVMLTKSKVVRLESRVKELEELLDNQSHRIALPEVDISGLRSDLVEARKKEGDATKRESELKSANRDLKMQVNDLERDLHEARLAQLKSRSPSASPPASHSKELARLRQELFDAQAEVRELQHAQRDLQRAAKRSVTQGTERADLEELVKSKAQEAQSLAKQLALRTDEVLAVRADIKRLQEEVVENRNQPSGNTTYIIQLQELRTQVKRLRSERDELRETSQRMPARGVEAVSMKMQLQRLRAERSQANKKAEAVEQELETLQLRYESILERLSSTSKQHGKQGDIREKEIKGLIREITWLKARCRREERLRHDLAWSKSYLEQGEAMRAQCNQVDLRILREMGVSVADKQKYEKKLDPIQKLRAGVFVVVAAIRMSRMEEQWREAKMIGHELARNKKMRHSQTQG